MAVSSTRLRYISAGTPSDLTITVSRLPFKVEIKGNPVRAGNRWYLFFVLPEEEKLDMQNIEV